MILKMQIQPALLMNISLLCQENISGVPAFLLLLDHFSFFSKVKEQLMKKTVDLTSASSMTSYQNVSTSCSTPATDIEYGYEGINGDTNDALSTDDGSTVPISTRSGDERSSNPGGSSSECLLSSSPDSLNSEPVKTGQIYSRSVVSFTFDVPLEPFMFSFLPFPLVI